MDQVLKNEVTRVVGPEGALEIFGIRLVGINAENGIKFLITLLFILLVSLLWRIFRFIAHKLIYTRKNERLEFWTRQTIRISETFVLIIGLVSIWFDDPARFATALGLLTAGLAFALQKVVTAIAGYFNILDGKIFKVGDRIVMGGVRGDVIAIRFTQTTIMEMGQPPPVQKDDPAMWIKARQYTGRIVTVSNARIFDEPVYNYTRDFPYIWEEMSIPIRYGDDYNKAEQILMDVANRHTATIENISNDALQELMRRYFLKPADVGPKVYYILTDNWLEVTIRFIVEVWGIRETKHIMSREILFELEKAGIHIASATFEIVGLPPLRFNSDNEIRNDL